MDTEVNHDFLNLYLEKLNNQCAELLKANLIMQTHNELKDRTIQQLAGRITEAEQLVQQKQQENSPLVDQLNERISALENDKETLQKNFQNLERHRDELAMRNFILQGDIQTIQNNYKNLEKQFDENLKNAGKNPKKSRAKKAKPTEKIVIETDGDVGNSTAIPNGILNIESNGLGNDDF